jgi:hypothetical protein
MLIADFTVAELPIFGSVGENVAVPLTVLHVGFAAAAPAWVAIIPAGSTIAAANNTPANLRIRISPWVGPVKYTPVYQWHARIL